jgi:hypothetical protein
MSKEYKGIHTEKPMDFNSYFDRLFSDMQKFFPDKQSYRGPYIEPKPPVQINTTDKHDSGLDDIVRKWKRESELVFEERPKIAKCVPYQLCPKCDGEGQVPSISTTSVYKSCPICYGAKLIPMHILKEE